MFINSNEIVHITLPFLNENRGFVIMTLVSLVKYEYI